MDITQHRHQTTQTGTSHNTDITQQTGTSHNTNIKQHRQGHHTTQTGVSHDTDTTQHRHHTTQTGTSHNARHHIKDRDIIQHRQGHHTTQTRTSHNLFECFLGGPPSTTFNSFGPGFVFTAFKASSVKLSHTQTLVLQNKVCKHYPVNKSLLHYPSQIHNNLLKNVEAHVCFCCFVFICFFFSWKVPEVSGYALTDTRNWTSYWY